MAILKRYCLSRVEVIIGFVLVLNFFIDLFQLLHIIFFNYYMTKKYFFNIVLGLSLTNVAFCYLSLLKKILFIRLISLPPFFRLQHKRLTKVLSLLLRPIYLFSNTYTLSFSLFQIDTHTLTHTHTHTHTHAFVLIHFKEMLSIDKRCP